MCVQFSNHHKNTMIKNKGIDVLSHISSRTSI